MTGGDWRDATAIARVRRAAARRFGVDARSLAALRVALAALVLLDLLLRARHLTAFYTDAGVLPRSLLFAEFGTVSELSLHALSGAAWWQATLFALTAVTALAMLVGYRTTVATVLTGLLVTSLHYRNPLVLNSGDTLLRMLFLWAVFLPLGGRWSVDALRRTPDNGGPRQRVATVATAGVLVQVVLVYATNAVLKLRSDAWLAGDATQRVLQLDMFTLAFGEVLAQYPAVVTAVDRVWLALLLAAPLLLVFTGVLRAVFAGLFAAVHAGMLFSMQLGLFPLVSIVALLPFVPGAVWDQVPGWQSIRSVRELPVGRYSRRTSAALPLVDLPAVPRVLAHWYRRVVPVLLTLLVVGLVVWNAATVGLLGLPSAAPVDESPDERWGMFAPSPVATDYWIVAPGELESGARVDAFRGGPVDWTEPADVARSYPTSRWRKYVSNVRRPPGSAVAGGFAAYLCTRDAGGGDAELVAVTVYVVEQSVTLDGVEDTRRVELAHRNCSV